MNPNIRDSYRQIIEEYTIQEGPRKGQRVIIGFSKEPLVVRQQGKVRRARPHPAVVEWEDGTREKVRLERMPDEFASYQAGQPFEAVVHRHPVSHKLLKVEYVKRLPAVEEPTAEELRRLWDALPTSQSLPDADWD